MFKSFNMSDEDEYGIDDVLGQSLEDREQAHLLLNSAKNEKETFYPYLRGPKSLATGSYPYPAPLGSYGEGNAVVDAPVNENEAAVVNVMVNNDLDPIPDFEQLLSPGSTDRAAESKPSITFSKEGLLSLRHSEVYHEIWKQRYEEIIRRDFPELYLREPLPPRTKNGAADAYLNESEYEPPILFLRDYQEEIVQRSLRGENDIILLPTGTGKTYVAIRVIISHIQKRLSNGDKVKVIFFVPTVDLAAQQLKLLQKYIPSKWAAKCTQITGDDCMSAAMVKDMIQDTKHLVLFVTPAIIQNYFTTSRDASLSDFSLLLFDEYHHAKKKHNYNMIACRYARALNREMEAEAIGSLHLPQMMGMTATIGIGDKKDQSGAKEFILNMCAKFNLKAAPCHGLSLGEHYSLPNEKFIQVNARSDGVSTFIQNNLMEWLESELMEKVVQPSFLAALGKVGDFPSVRADLVYLQFVINLETAIIEVSHTQQIQKDAQYCKVALEHLKRYHWCLHLNQLLPCEYGLKYLQEWKGKPELQGVPEIWELFEGNLSTVAGLQEHEDRTRGNEKITKLKRELEVLFTEKPDSKVIIFVQMKIVAKYMAELLNEHTQTFRANEFISDGSEWDAAMSPQQRIDVRTKFEGNKYNILVATSLLEEGIDIQACNMVVRYMYVKDMIAKIQSRGRARKTGGVLLSILDEKLANQEKANDFKEKLMFAALKEIRDMNEEVFQAEMQKRLAALRVGDEDEEDSMEAVEEPGSDVHVCCTLCSSFLGHLRDVRVFMQSHHPVMDDSLPNRVIVRHLKKSTDMYDGILGLGSLLCANKLPNSEKPCGCKVGVLIKLTPEFKFATWRIKGITLNVGETCLHLSQYKEIKELYKIRPVYIEDIEEMGPRFQFLEQSDE